MVIPSLQNAVRKKFQHMTVEDVVLSYNRVKTEEQRLFLANIIRSKLENLEYAPWIFQIVLTPNWEAYGGRWYWGRETRFPQIDPKYKITTEDYEVRGNPRQLVQWKARDLEQHLDVLNFMLPILERGEKASIGVQHWPRQIVAVIDSTGRELKLQEGKASYWYPLDLVIEEESEPYWEMLMNLEYPV